MAIFLSFTGHLLFSFNRGIVPTKNETINVGSSGVIAFSPFFPTRHEPCPCFMTPGLLSAHEFHLNMEFCLLNLFLRPYMQCYCEKRPCLNQEVNRCACSISCDLKPRILPSFRAILRYFFVFRKQSLWALSPLYNWVWQIQSQSFPRRWMGQLPFIPAVTFLMPAFCCWRITHYSAEKEAGELEFSAMDIERKSDLRETENETR